MPRKWYGNLKYGATAEYECGPYAHFSNVTANVTYNTATLECKWNKEWHCCQMAMARFEYTMCLALRA